MNYLVIFLVSIAFVSVVWAGHMIFTRNRARQHQPLPPKYNNVRRKPAPDGLYDKRR